MKSNYEQRRQARKEAFLKLSASNTQLSTSLWKETNQMASMMNGQPILIGHHSEGRHRRDIEKMHSKMSRSVQADKKAEHYADRAETIEKNYAISSDDPNALSRLTDKLEKLVKMQETVKAANIIVKSKKLLPEQKVVQLQTLGFSEEKAKSLLEPDFAGRLGFPRFVLSNNNQNMKTIRDRIAKLNALSQIKTTEEEINGRKLVINAEDNRVQIFFDNKPTEEIRIRLKRSGFRWAPSVGAWMKQINLHAIWQAKEILKSLAA